MGIDRLPVLWPSMTCLSGSDLQFLSWAFFFVNFHARNLHATEYCFGDLVYVTQF